jgi:hypothetical protein
MTALKKLGGTLRSRLNSAGGRHAALRAATAAAIFVGGVNAANAAAAARVPVSLVVAVAFVLVDAAEAAAAAVAA